MSIPFPPNGQRVAEYPQNFASLVNYLRQHRRVSCKHPTEGESFKGQFLRVDQDGHLHFITDEGQHNHIPAGGPCGPGKYKPQLDFFPDGFGVELFGMRVEFFYFAPPTVG